MKKILLSLAVMLMTVITVNAQNELPKANMQLPNSPVLQSTPGMVVMMWGTDVMPRTSPITVKLNAPGVEANVPAELVEPEETDTGENFGYPFTTLEFDLAPYINAAGNNWGEWVITIPAGIVMAADGSGRINPEQSNTIYWYYNNSSFSTTPYFGSIQQMPSYNRNDLKNVRITWSGVSSVNRNSLVKDAYLERVGGGLVYLDDIISVSGNALVMDLSGLIEAQYKLYIPAGYVYLTTSGGVKQVNAEISVTGNWFSVTDGMSSGNATLSSNKQYVDVKYTGQKLELTGNGTVLLYPDEWKDGTPVTIPKGNVTLQSSDVVRIKFDDVALTSAFYMPDRMIVVPAGLVRNAEGQLNPAQNIIFKVDIAEASGVAIWTPEPESSIDPAKDKIRFTYRNTDQISYKGGAYLLNEEGRRTNLSEKSQFNENGQVESVSDDPSNPWVRNIIEFNFSMLNLTDGKYTIVMPARSFTIITTDFVETNSPAMQYVFYVGEKPVIEPEPDPDPDDPDPDDPDDPDNPDPDNPDNPDPDDPDNPDPDDPDNPDPDDPDPDDPNESEEAPENLYIVP